MIAGIGMDLIEIARIRQVWTRFGDRFLSRVYGTGEVEYCLEKHDPVLSLAARFAAKEAAMKALGTGVSRGVSFRQIEVVREKGEAPTIRFQGRAKERANELGVRSASLTLTHEAGVAAAVVILEK
jgi:holo-[acyl-carrier protein] synthase